MKKELKLEKYETNKQKVLIYLNELKTKYRETYDADPIVPTTNKVLLDDIISTAYTIYNVSKDAILGNLDKNIIETISANIFDVNSNKSIIDVISTFERIPNPNLENLISSQTQTINNDRHILDRYPNRGRRITSGSSCSRTNTVQDMASNVIDAIIKLVEGEFNKLEDPDFVIGYFDDDEPIYDWFANELDVMVETLVGSDTGDRYLVKLVELLIAVKLSRYNFDMNELSMAHIRTTNFYAICLTYLIFENEGDTKLAPIYKATTIEAFRLYGNQMSSAVMFRYDDILSTEYNPKNTPSLSPVGIDVTTRCMNILVDYTTFIIMTIQQKLSTMNNPISLNFNQNQQFQLTNNTLSSEDGDNLNISRIVEDIYYNSDDRNVHRKYRKSLRTTISLGGQTNDGCYLARLLLGVLNGKSIEYDTEFSNHWCCENGYNGSIASVLIPLIIIRLNTRGSGFVESVNISPNHVYNISDFARNMGDPSDVKTIFDYIVYMMAVKSDGSSNKSNVLKLSSIIGSKFITCMIYDFQYNNNAFMTKKLDSIKSHAISVDLIKAIELFNSVENRGSSYPSIIPYVNLMLDLCDVRCMYLTSKAITNKIQNSNGVNIYTPYTSICEHMDPYKINDLYSIAKSDKAFIYGIERLIWG